MDPPTDAEAVRAKYRALRDAERTLNKKLLTMLPKQAIPESARTLGFWYDGDIAMSHEGHLGVITDYAVYDYRLRNSTNAVERLWKQKLTKPGTPAYEVAEAMQSAQFTALEIAEVVRGTGAVVTDLMYGGRHFLADIILSENSEPGLTMAARLLTFPEFVMTTGAPFGVEPEYIKRIVAMLKDEAAAGGDRIRKLTVKNKSRLTALVIRQALAPDGDEDDYRSGRK